MKVQGTPLMHVSIQFQEIGLNKKGKFNQSIVKYIIIMESIKLDCFHFLCKFP
jgi:hypothetical protein